MRVVVVLVLMMFIGICQGFRSGAPLSACGAMLPSHGSRNRPQDHSRNPAPFAITIEGGYDTYRPRDRLELSVHSTVSSEVIRGFLLEARTISGDPSGPVGEFVNAERGTKLSCNEKAVTHYRTWRVRGDKFHANWVAPDADIGEIVFVATVVKRYETFWSNVRSVVIRPYRPPSTPAPTEGPRERPVILNDVTTNTNVTSVCEESLLTSLPEERPHVAILCSAHAQCPCGWYCCPNCVNSVCVGHAICRQPQQTESVVGEVKPDEESVEVPVINREYEDRRNPRPAW